MSAEQELVAPGGSSDTRTASTIRNTAALPSTHADAPDGGYGWVCVGACFLINCFTWGIVASYGVYLQHYLSQNIFPGARTIDFALIGGLNFAAAMALAPVVTIMSRKLGPHVTMAIGAGLQALGLLSASFASRVWQLYISQGALLGIGVSLLYIPSTAVLSQWFGKKRSLANGLSTAGSGIGGLIFSFATEAMIDQLSLRWSFRITAGTALVAHITSIILLRDRNKIIKPPQRGFDFKLLRRADVCLLLAWSSVSMFGYITILFSLADFATSIGLLGRRAAALSAFLNLGTAIGRPLIGVVSDRLGRFNVAGSLTALCGISCFAIWLPATSYAPAILFALIDGAIFGVFWVTIGPLCAEVAGIQELPSMLSLSWLSVTLPSLVSEVIALKLRRPSSRREYLYPQIFAGTAYILASLFMCILWWKKRR